MYFMNNENTKSSCFLESFEVDLLAIREESKIRCRNLATFNYTFITLIPKFNKVFNMEDFKSISLCKCIYKLIAKIITNMIRGIFSTIVSSEQFDFLEGRHIHDAIGIT